ncbi:FtsX-like permease family protein [Phytohabitans aurantiacus]|uniref:Membrane protein n=1 Tax=Phytohabitans aurantiacus TaxID=3016789 RepID=A0ABQ5QM55_9ACTN|nr:FtsX-like permease family protein [Phytohabitans aurantiacus]GLH94872.1 membrane protein [Phytohabitans aurantiacus]
MIQVLHRVRVFVGQFLLLAVLAAGAAALVTGAPRMANDLADRALREDVRRLPTAARDLTLSQKPQPFGDALIVARAQAELDRYRATLPQPLPGLIGDKWFAASTGPDRVSTRVGSGPVVDFGLRTQTGVEEAGRITSGRWPATEESAPQVEIALSAAVARALGVTVGSVLPVTAADPRPLPAVVVGIFEPLDATAPVWDDMRLALEPFPGLPPDVPPRSIAVTDHMGMTIAAERLRALSYSWRYRIDENRLDSGDLDAVTAALAQVKRQPPALSTVTSALDSNLARFTDQLRAVQALLAVVQAGLLATLFGLIALAASLAVERRRSEFALLRARGGAVLAIGGRTLAEAVVVVPAATVAGWLLGRLAPGRPSAMEWLALVIGVVATLAVPVLAAAGQRRLTFVTRRHDLTRHKPSVRRLTAEVFVLVVAVLGAYLLRQRGLTAERGVDPFLSAVPVLLATGAALVALRIFPWPLRQLGRLTAGARGAVAFIGLARAGRGGPVTAGPLAVLVIAISTGIFSGAVFTAVDDARDRAANHDVPADAVLNGYVFAAGTAERLAEVPGVAAVAPVAFAAGTTVRSTANDLTQAQVLVVDGSRFAEVVKASGVDVRLPGALSAAKPGEGPVPAVVSAGLAAEIGDGGSVQVRGAAYDFTAGAVVDSFPGIDLTSRRFVVLPWQALPEKASPLLPNRFLIAGDRFDQGALLAAADEGQREYAVTVRMVPSRTSITTWPGYRDGLDRTGANDVLSFAFLTGTVGASVLALLAVGFTVLSGAPQRGRVLSRLRTLGMSAGQGRGLLVYELVPLAGIAVIAGGLVGTLLPAALGPALGLSTFTSGEAVRTYLDPLVGAAVLALVVIGLATAVLMENLINRRLRLGEVLRVGEESS